MSSGRSADGREVQIPLQQVAPPLISSLSCTPITPPSHRSANPWALCELTTQQGRNTLDPSGDVTSLRPSAGVTGLLCAGVPASFLPPHGGFRDRFVETPEAKYRCEKCRLVLCHPRQTECGHRFCQSCINDLLSRTKNPVLSVRL
uniref:TNF receptor-associated factor 3/5 RING domain-containing protein n=1 Tax=Kryptolebias marmoratus TaxID=37003 RepID=A0A3Q2ZDK6_KRYMA